MIRKTFESDIQQVKDEVLALGSMVEHAIISSVEALKKRDIKAAEKIIAEDKEINKKRFAIENQLMILIATQQPMAHDLRLLASTMEIISELERMGDYAKGIAIINLRSGGLSLPKILEDLEYMANHAVDMLHRSLTAFIELDVDAAHQIAFEDNVVDSLYEQVYYEVMDFVIENPSQMERANFVLWSAHNIERLADRVTNICERIVFVATGQMQPVEEMTQKSPM